MKTVLETCTTDSCKEFLFIYWYNGQLLATMHLFAVCGSVDTAAYECKQQNSITVLFSKVLGWQVCVTRIPVCVAAWTQSSYVIDKKFPPECKLTRVSSGNVKNTYQRRMLHAPGPKDT